MPDPVLPPAAPDGRVRAVIDAVRPSVDGGRFAVKRVNGERIDVEAHCFTEGHDALRVVLRWRAEAAAEWNEVEMQALGNDVWRAGFVAGSIGRYRYTVVAWVDHFRTWRDEFGRREDAADLRIAARIGAGLIEEAAGRARAEDAKQLKEWTARLRAAQDVETIRASGLDGALAEVAMRYPDRTFAAQWPVELPLVVDRERARFSAWYELFPRSASEAPGRHGTFKDVEKRLAYVAELGFDVLYLAPIHPIGRGRRKGRNNALVAGPDDVGSPWAIGAAEGGHKAIHPQLGTIVDFRSLVAAAKRYGLELALDIAYQCAPDHPYVKQHPNWFRWRPDGSVQYAENPPKKYEDIYPFNFACAEWPALWQELKSMFDFWIEQGVAIFRVDNPHTKPFAFWEWLIGEVKGRHPEVIFLSEAFTRPKVMHRLAKLGFTQSYTYFPWRNAKGELIEYFTELARSGSREYFRPNHWPNTPDILTAFLQHGGRAAFMSRLVLAATLGANYGIYGPAFEHCENVAREPGAEEYLNSEKYEVRHWDLAQPGSLRDLIAAVNRARRENPALQQDWNLRFIPVDNDELICYGKFSDDRANVVIVAVNLDPRHVRSGWMDLPLEELGIERDHSFQVEDLLTGTVYSWEGPRSYVELDPKDAPAQVFRVKRRVLPERDFERSA